MSRRSIKISLYLTHIRLNFVLTANVILFHSRYQRAWACIVCVLGGDRASFGWVRSGSGVPWVRWVQCPVRTVPADKPPRPPPRHVEDSTRIDVVRVRPGQLKRRTRRNERTRRRRSNSQLVSATMPSAGFSTHISPLLDPMILFNPRCLLVRYSILILPGKLYAIKLTRTTSFSRHSRAQQFDNHIIKWKLHVARQYLERRLRELHTRGAYIGSA